jgi:bifunctional DNA-binding transcriptional regulator/antitoxin component of YhaV-PrlF toxin-antitoxin module
MTKFVSSAIMNMAEGGSWAVALGKVLGRGQITLPRDVRRAAKIQPGDTVSIQAVGPGKVEVRVLSRLTLKDLLELYPIEGPIDLAADREKWEAEAAKEVLGRDAE